MRISIPNPPPSRTMNGFAYYFASTARSTSSAAERGLSLLGWLSILGFKHSLGDESSVTFLSDEGEPIETAGRDVAHRLAAGKVTMKSWIGSCEDLVFSTKAAESYSVEWYSLTYLEFGTAMSFGNALIERFRLRASSDFEDFLIWDWTGASEDVDWLSLPTSARFLSVTTDVLGLPTRFLGGRRDVASQEGEVIGRSVLLLASSSCPIGARS